MSEENILSAIDLLLQLKEKCDAAGLREFCRQNELDPGNVSNVLHLRKPMQPSIIRVLGYEEVKMYRKIKS